MFYLPIIGAFLEASGTILVKKILKKSKINSTTWTVFGFLGVVIVMIPFIYFFWKINYQAFQLKNILILLLIVTCAIFANLLTYYSLKRETISELEPITLLQPLMTILIAFLFSFFFAKFSNEGNIKILILAIIASVALIVSHLKKHHLYFNKYIISAIIGSFLFSMELVLSKFILDYYSSFTFYFIRCTIILIICYLIFRPNFKTINNKIKLLTIGVGIIWVIYRVIIYIGYEKLGVVFTTTLFILSPVLIYIFAVIFLKEKPNLKTIISATIILSCVITSIIFKYWKTILILTIITIILMSFFFNFFKKNKDIKIKNNQNNTKIFKTKRTI
ncbi:MAG: DMT family transporter [Candidatus Pacearchaeota archaeon]